nr:zinc finger matrin-type protein 5 [Bactrocera oleae]
MGGKSYYCDYCCCFLKNDVNVRKTHNSGLTHNMAKLRYMRRFEDPRKVLEQEVNKEPCTRYLNGRYCKFDLMCKSTHYNKEQLEQLRKIVKRLEKFQRPKVIGKLKNDKKRMLPWHRNSEKSYKLMNIKRLPESLRPINFDRFNDDCLKLEWG